MVGGSVSATLMVILAVAAIFMMTVLWSKKCVYNSAVQAQPQSKDHQVALVHIQPHINVYQLKNDTDHEYEDID